MNDILFIIRRKSLKESQRKLQSAKMNENKRRIRKKYRLKSIVHRIRSSTFYKSARLRFYLKLSHRSKVSPQDNLSSTSEEAYSSCVAKKERLRDVHFKNTSHMSKLFHSKYPDGKKPGNWSLPQIRMTLSPSLAVQPPCLRPETPFYRRKNYQKVQITAKKGLADRMESVHYFKNTQSHFSYAKESDNQGERRKKLQRKPSQKKFREE